MEATMLAHTPTFTRKRRAVEFHTMRSARDMLLSLPIVDDVVPLAPTQDLQRTGTRAQA
jgi:hypothetical protein